MLEEIDGQTDRLTVQCEPGVAPFPDDDAALHHVDLLCDDTSYVVDVAFIFMGRSAQDVAEKVAKKLEAIIAVFAKFGLELNFGPKKTEVIFTARGPHQTGRGW